MSNWKIQATAFTGDELQVTLVAADGKNRRTGKNGSDLLEKLLTYAPELHDGQKVNP